LVNSSNSHFVSSIALQYGRGLHRFLSFRLRNVQDVQDLAQEVYLRLLRVESHEAIRNPEAYLFTIASHVLHQHSLRQAANASFIDISEAIPELFSPPGEDPCTKAENSERVARFQKILERLPPRVRLALLMHRIGFTVQEVATELGVARETAKKYLSRAAEHCREAGYGGASSRKRRRLGPLPGPRKKA
jgi:RNA polymerase sigma-70 factor (ECF subfamily)